MMLASHSLRLPLLGLLAQLAACQMSDPAAQQPDAGSDASPDVAERPDAGSDATPPGPPLGTRWVQPATPPRGRIQVLGAVGSGDRPVLALDTGDRTLLRSDDYEGQTWVPIPGAPPVPRNNAAGDDTAVLAVEGHVVYIVSHAGGALVSRDDGRTFERFELGLPRGIATQLAFDGYGRMFALGVEDDPSNANPAPAAYVSQDGGRTFSEIFVGGRPQGIFATSRVTLASNDSGEVMYGGFGPSWSALALPEFDAPRLFFGSHGDIYASGQRLFRATDGGFSWTWLADVAVESFTYSGRSVYAASDGRVLRVEGDGTLTPIGQPLPRTASMGIADAGGTLVVGTEADGIWRLRSDDSTWVPATPENCSFEHLTVFEGGLAATRRLSHSVFVSTDRATTWHPHGERPEATGSAVYVLTSGPSGLYAGTLGGVLRSMDGGATWQTIASGLNDDGSDFSGKVLAVEEADGRLFVGIEGWAGFGTYLYGGVFVSADGGASWRLSDTGLPVRTGMRTRPAGITALRALGNHVVLAATQPDGNTAASVYRSVDDGAHWTRSDIGFAPLQNDRIQHLVRNGSAVYAVTEHRVFRSDDGGVQWVRVSFGLPDDAVIRDLAAGQEFAAVATEGHGVYVSRDQGATGAALVSGLPTAPVLRLAVQGGALYASLRDRGVWRLE
jgi:photosystem II stability/assembly factor-like uncharacterized protein